MDGNTVVNILNQLASNSPTIGILVCCLIYMHNTLKKSQEESKSQTINMVNELNKERSERISLLEKHIEQCDEDRRELRQSLYKIQELRGSKSIS